MTCDPETWLLGYLRVVLRLPADDRGMLMDRISSLVAAVVEAFNARDVDGLQALVSPDARLPGFGEDRRGFARGVEDCWDRSPQVLATAGRLEGSPAVVLWTPTNSRWWRSGVIIIEAGDSGLSYAELVEAGSTLDDVVADEPEQEHEEAAPWEDWEEEGGGD